MAALGRAFECVDQVCVEPPRMGALFADSHVTAEPGFFLFNRPTSRPSGLRSGRPSPLEDSGSRHLKFQTR